MKKLKEIDGLTKLTVGGVGVAGLLELAGKMEPLELLAVALVLASIVLAIGLQDNGKVAARNTKEQE